MQLNIKKYVKIIILILFTNMGLEKEELLAKSIKAGKGVKKMSTQEVINFLKIKKL